MDDVKEGDDPVFLVLTLKKDGGLSYELNMTNAPDRHSSLSRAVGNAGIALWQIQEWATRLLRMSVAARESAEAGMREMLERLADNGPVN